MKKIIICALVLCSALFFVSCVSISKTESATSRNIVGLGVLQTPTVATLEVSPTKVTELYTFKTKSGLTGDKATANIKTQAIAKLLIKYNADILVEPRYSIETISSKFSSTYNIIISGYPATYKNFRPAVAADTALLKLTPTSIEPTRMVSTIEPD
jgi:PBP1b-binding outer membrane lipoprotein LpoB